MTTDYGIDLSAVGDLPAGDEFVTGEECAAQQVIRRTLTPDGGLADIGETESYTSVDVRESFGRRMSAAEIRNLELTAAAGVNEEPFVDFARVTVTVAGGRLSTAIYAEGDEGPFSTVVHVDEAGAVLVSD